MYRYGSLFELNFLYSLLGYSLLELRGSRGDEHVVVVVYMQIICCSQDSSWIVQTVCMETERGKRQRPVGEYTLTTSYLLYFGREYDAMRQQGFGACQLK
jgi:hypothetical protein